MIEQWFNQLAPRERRTLVIGAIVLGGIIMYFMVWEPFIKARAQLENIVTAQKETLRWMLDAATEVEQFRRLSYTPSSTTHKQSLLSLIDKSTRQGALSKIDKRIEPKGEQEVRVTFTQVSFTELMYWLGQLYNQHQVQISTISIEGQHVPDKVKVYLTLKMDK